MKYRNLLINRPKNFRLSSQQKNANVSTYYSEENDKAFMHPELAESPDDVTTRCAKPR